MMPSRHVSGHSSAIRKSRLDKPSMLPVRRQGSTDRASTEARRPSTTGARSSSAEPARGTFGARLSRDASATKLSSNKRSRSQTGENRYGHTTTPLRSSHYSRPTTTPLRTPDRDGCNWEACLERVLAFVTVKDQRQISSVAWQRAEYARVCAALGARGAAGAALVRPLSIARFVDIVAELLTALIGDPKLSTDNYVTKLPNIAKRLVYPSPVSKSWLKTVNTLHAFPHALALIAYLLDMATHLRTPLSDERLYIANDELSCLRRDLLDKCWIRFQEPPGDFSDLNEEYLRRLSALLGDDDDKIQQLEHDIEEYNRRLGDPAELEARADEARRVERRDELLGALRDVRGRRRACAADAAALRAAIHDDAKATSLLDADIERASAEIEQLRVQLEQQPLSVEERTALLERVDYATRVHDSKRALAEQISKMLVSKETELAQWQKRTLDSCVEYKQGLIHLSATLPALAGLAIDEQELMGAECAAYMKTAVETLRAEGARLAAKKAELLRSRSALDRKRAVLLEETHSKIAAVKSNMQREQQALDEENAKESADAAAWSHEMQQTSARLQQLRANQQEHAKIAAELAFWQEQDSKWRAKLDEVRAYISAQREHTATRLAVVRESRAASVRNTLALWRDKLNL